MLVKDVPPGTPTDHLGDHSLIGGPMPIIRITATVAVSEGEIKALKQRLITPTFVLLQRVQNGVVPTKQFWSLDQTRSEIARLENSSSRRRK